MEYGQGVFFIIVLYHLIRLISGKTFFNIANFDMNLMSSSKLSKQLHQLVHWPLNSY